MYDTEMIKDFETKFQSAALVELLKEPLNMLVILEVIDTWRIIDEFLTAEKEAYNQQYAIRLEQLKVTIPVIITAKDSASNWLKLIGIGLLGAAGVGYILWQLTPSQAAKRAEAKTRKIVAKARRKVVEIESKNKVQKEILKGQLERKKLLNQYKESESGSSSKEESSFERIENTNKDAQSASRLNRLINQKLERRQNANIYQQRRHENSEMLRRGWIPIALTS